MGRVKVFFRNFCLNRKPGQADCENSFNHKIDVSHLATPHVSSNLSLTPGSSSSSILNGESNNDNENHHQYRAHGSSITNQPEPRDYSRQDVASPFSHQLDSNRTQPSTPSSPSPPSQPPNPPQEQQQRQHQNLGSQNQAFDQSVQISKGTATKLSYDIISVREPLAKILAERQQAQHQRQMVGEHEYIEVYGERGSSCFYEEIAGSTTSSATYDQIGVSPNHNYQALANAYAVSNRPTGSNQDESSADNHRENIASSRLQDSPHNDTPAPNQVQDPSTIIARGDIPASCNSTADESSLPRQFITRIQNNPSQSIPVYSVINRAARRSNAIIRATIDSCRPPQPPPKNLTTAQQPSTSAISSCQEPRGQSSRGVDSAANISSGRSYSQSNTPFHNRLPQPPPRYSKKPTFNATNRPLPLPDIFESTNDPTYNEINPYPLLDEDLESLNNGYELLCSNLDDDQIDVGYERIRESSRYSGGSLSSQFCPLQMLDNDGYESVQPIYSSPSNALVEPNYEAIGSATASELAAAATARLTAAATVIEQFLKQDQ